MKFQGRVVGRSFDNTDDTRKRGKMADGNIKQTAPQKIRKKKKKKDFWGEIYPDPKPIEGKSQEDYEVGLSQH